MFYKIARLCAVIMIPFVLAACASKQQPVKVITFWHDYNGKQKAIVEQLVDEFNSTIGISSNTVVETTRFRLTKTMEQTLVNSASGRANSKPLPNVFLAEPDITAALLDGDKLAKLNGYFSNEELQDFSALGLDKLYPAKEGIYTWPLNCTAEAILVNETDWNIFKRQAGLSDADLQTWQGIYNSSALYYKWTDEKTPNIQGDGSTFFAIHSFAHIMEVAGHVFGSDLFSVDENGKGSINLSEASLNEVWMFYYRSAVMGYADGNPQPFLYTDIKTKSIISYIGGSGDAAFFPSRVITQKSQYDISLSLLPYPKFADAPLVTPVDIKGFGITSSTDEKQQASVNFVRWLTSNANSAKLFSTTGLISARESIRNSAEFAKELETLSQSDDDTSKNILNSYNFTLKRINSSESMAHNTSFVGSILAKEIMAETMETIIRTDKAIANSLILEGFLEQDVFDQLKPEQRYKYWIAVTKKKMQDMNLLAY